VTTLEQSGAAATNALDLVSSAPANTISPNAMTNAPRPHIRPMFVFPMCLIGKVIGETPTA
jgi:hypothetical protein